MGQIFMTAANAVLPIVLMILLGYFLKQIGFFNKEFLAVGNKLVFKICLPMTLFMSVYSIDSLRDVRWDVVLYCVALTLLIFGLGIVTAIRTTKVIARRGVMVQCIFRSNFAIIGLPLAVAVGGDQAEAVAAVVTAFVVPLFNVLAVVALSIFDDQQKNRSIGSVLLNILKNPLILGIAAAFLCQLIRQAQVSLLGETVFTLQDQLPFLYKVMSQLKSITTPLALMVLGGQFVFSAAKGMMKEIVIGTAWRVVIAPVIGVGIAVLLSKYTALIQFGTNEYPALVGLFGSPVAVSSAIMAKQMGADDQLATQYVVWTSICSMVTVFLLVSAMIAMGLLAG